MAMRDLFGGATDSGTPLGPTEFEAFTRNGTYKFRVSAASKSLSNKQRDEDRELDQLERYQRKKPLDTRYNCFGHCFAAGLGWVGSVRVTQEEVRRILLVGEQDFEFDTDFDARKVLLGNGWAPLIKGDMASLGLKTHVEEEVLPGDIAVYSVDASTPPEHVAMIVSGGNTPRDWQAISKLGASGEFIHPAFDLRMGGFAINRIEIWTDREGYEPNS